MSDSFVTPWSIDCQVLCPWDFLGKNTGVGCHFLLQGIFFTQGSNSSLLHLLHWHADSLPLQHLRSPRSPLVLQNISWPGQHQRGSVLISLLQPFTGGHGQNVSHAGNKDTLIFGRVAGSLRGASLYAYSYRQNPSSNYNNKSNKRQRLK